MNFKVKVFHWFRGELLGDTYFFYRLEDAIRLGERFAEAEFIKVYNRAEEIVHEVSRASTDTYA